MSNRNAPTTPPPPSSATEADLDHRVTELRRIAGQILARANDLEQVLTSMRGAR